VASVRSATIRQALIREDTTLTWENSVTLAKQMDDYQSSAMAKQALPSEPVNAVYSGRQSTNRGHHASRSQAFNSHTGPRLGPPLPVDKYSNSNHNTICWRFGRSHHPARCRFKDANCHSCGKRGHIKPMFNVESSNKYCSAISF